MAFRQETPAAKANHSSYTKGDIAVVFNSTVHRSGLDNQSFNRARCMLEILTFGDLLAQFIG